mmetsp:Transcript_24248/g.28099  ORF Transcript_24248/g.28099 Transcript_24248/m.28099 type:complete len:131 (-) Transcript_24248:1038-1430(-)
MVQLASSSSYETTLAPFSKFTSSEDKEMISASHGISIITTLSSLIRLLSSASSKKTLHSVETFPSFSVHEGSKTTSTPSSTLLLSQQESDEEEIDAATTLGLGEMDDADRWNEFDLEESESLHSLSVILF